VSSRAGVIFTVTLRSDAATDPACEDEAVSGGEARRSRNGRERLRLRFGPGTLGFAALLASLAVAETIARALLRNLGVEWALPVGLFALAATIGLGFLRPLGAAILAGCANVLSLTGFHAATLAGLTALVIALYTVGGEARRPRTVLIASGTAGTFFLVLVFLGPPPISSEAAALTAAAAVILPATTLGGFAARSRREAQDSHRARIAASRDLLELTARGERTRIARELHDLVAHSLSMISAQAEAARLGVPDLPAAGAQRLRSIGDTARLALAEMRQLLGILRDHNGSDPPAERQPLPRLDEINDLIDDARDATGSSTRLILRGPPIELHPNVELAAYRIVQEALTNARRHAPGAAIDVELIYLKNQIHVRVRDNGPGPSHLPLSAKGHGLSGMRERAAAAGGTVMVRIPDEGGFCVDALLPARIGDAQ
jgi:signal transduction histidine kinase